jgi:Na+-transporting methylmalonyl-CoA/oxaloacetate decarboxylase gamma subunit
MNVESYSYALLTAGVGMGTVFFFLVLLSVMMLVIRRLFDTPVTVAKGAGDEEGASPGTAKQTTGGAEVIDSHGVPRWVIAGVLAYIATEETEYAPHSGIWTQRGQR